MSTFKRKKITLHAKIRRKFKTLTRDCLWQIIRKTYRLNYINERVKYRLFRISTQFLA